MGIDGMHSPKYWWMRAEEFHAKADNCQFQQTREALRKAAENYEDLARRVERVRTLEDLAGR